MHFAKLIDSLERFGRTLPIVVRDVTDDDSRWKPPDGAWSILEVVCHLADEEEFDFRKRAKLTLSNPSQPWPPIDPEGWAVERHYNDGILDEAVQRFGRLRTQSTTWLRSLESPDWKRAYDHPKLSSVEVSYGSETDLVRP